MTKISPFYPEEENKHQIVCNISKMKLEASLCLEWTKTPCMCVQPFILHGHLPTHAECK